MSGLRANQASLSIVSGNIANAQTPGYVTQTPNQIEVATGTSGTSVDVTGVSRQLDLYIQSQLRTETSGSGYADQMSNVLGQLQSVYGTPGGDGTLETTYNNFTSALQALSTSQGSESAQTAALGAAQSLAQSLNATSQGIQTLRTNVSQDIGSSVTQANADMSTIATINTQLQGLAPTDPAAATLMDQRDNAINDLSKLMDVRTVTDSSNETSVFTTTGVQLVGGELASKMTFTSPGTLTANNLYSSNPAQNGVGSLTIALPNGGSYDMVANKSITSGQIAADLTLRDQTLVQAQTQIDQLAATMSSALSDTTTAATPIAGSPAGFAVNTSNIQPGNTINLTLTNTGTNAKQQIIDRQRHRSDRVAAAECSECQSENDRRQPVRRRQRECASATQCAARPGAGILRLGHDAECYRIGRYRHQFDHDDNDGLLAGRRQRAGAAVHRRHLALYQRVHRRRLADDRLRRPHYRQPGAGDQSRELHRLQQFAGNSGRRHHAFGLSLFAADDGFIQLFAADRIGLDRVAVHRNHLRLTFSSSSASRPIRRPRQRRCSRARTSWSRHCNRNSIRSPASASTPRCRT